jgi:periplasmic protein TonB
VSARPASGPKLAGPIGVSLVVHVAVVALLVVAGMSHRAPVNPPTYRVTLVAAPAGDRAVGEVAPSPTPPAPTPPEAAPPKRAEITPKDMPALPKKREPPRRTAPATPTITKAPPKTAPTTKAGGGPTGGRGTDVANVNLQGIEFPYPGYLDNIVRQIALNFKPRDRDAGLRAEVFFIIQRDGSVTGIRLVSSSRNYDFDLEARGAIEAVGQTKSFGSLPSGFSEPVLPVIFSFDPSIIR